MPSLTRIGSRHGWGGLSSRAGFPSHDPLRAYGPLAAPRIETEGPRCGASTRNEIPGLLAGLAGIGYGLLQAAAPDRVPSVLLLRLPLLGAKTCA